jgi:adenylate kinase
MSARVIIATGISGSGRKEYLDKFERYASSLGKKVKVYQVGKLMLERAKQDGLNITPKNILNTNKHTMLALRSAVYESILKDFERDKKIYDCVIVSIHGFFYWKKTFHHSFDHQYVSRFKPDLFLTIMGDPVDVQKELAARDQWKGERLSVRDVSLWQNVETEVMMTWAALSKCKYFAFYNIQSMATLFKITFVPEMQSTYISMPMTHLSDPKDRERINKFIAKLERYFIVISPVITKGKLPEIHKGLNGKNETEYMTSHQQVKIDLDLFLGMCDRITVFFPKVVSSPGVMSELREAHETNKEALVIWPSQGASPFLTYYFDHSFPNEIAFFKYLEREEKHTPRFTKKLN